MALDLHFAPFFPQLAFFVNQEGAALDAHKLSAIKHLLFNDVELAAQFFIGVGQQLKWKTLLSLEFFMRADAVPRYAENDGILAPKLRMQIAEILSLCGTARCRVLRIKIQNHFLSTHRFQMHCLVARRRTLEIGHYTIECWSRQFTLSSYMTGYALTGSRIESRLSCSQRSRNSSRNCAIGAAPGMLTVICTENIGAPVCAAA